MNRSLIELTRNALGKDFLVKRIEREVIENVAKDLLPLQEKVENDQLERVIDELCKEQDKILEERAIKVLKSIIDMSWEDVYELCEILDNVWVEGSDVYLESEDINDVDKLIELIGEFYELKDCMEFRYSDLQEAYENDEEDEDIQIEKSRVESVIMTSVDIIVDLEHRQSEIEDGQE